MLLGLAWASQLASADDNVIGFRIDDSSDNARPAGTVTNSNGYCVRGEPAHLAPGGWARACCPTRCPRPVAAPEGRRSRMIARAGP